MRPRTRTSSYSFILCDRHHQRQHHHEESLLMPLLLDPIRHSLLLDTFFFGLSIGISRYSSPSLLSQSLYHICRLVVHLEHLDKALLTWHCSFLQQHDVVCHKHEAYHPAHSFYGSWFWILLGFTVRYSIEFSSSLLPSLS